MLNDMTSRTVIANFLFILACMPGCMAFSDSSAMRIEVEVYKGPLSLEPEIQVGEIYGYLVEAQSGMIGILKFTERALADKKITNGPFDFLLKVLHLRLSFDTSISTALLKSTHNDLTIVVDKLRHSICLFEGDSGTGSCANEPTSKEVKDNDVHQFFNDFNKTRASRALDIKSNLSPETLANVSRTAATMQAAAFRYSTMSTIGVPHDPLARIAATFFAVAASEYGNQIEARADALLKQLGKYGRDRRELPLSTHLRESEPTDFVHLFDWVDGHTPRPLDYVHLNVSPNVEERIKIIERLYADHFWSKINTVYASGRGKTQMAFIKDETGNWNLKSFANDPTELLEAYTNVAQKALERAAELAASASTGGGSTSISLARSLVSFATESEPDKAISQTSPPGTLSLAHLRTRLANKLDSTQFNADFAKETELLGAVASKEKDAKAAASKPDTTDSQKQAADNALASARKDLLQYRHQIVARWEAIVSDHSNLVDILSSTVKKK